MRVVGLGTQDDLALARDFVAKGGITFTMLWDRAGGSWRALGIPIQPAAILYGPDGAELGRWQGLMDEEEILDLVGG